MKAFVYIALASILVYTVKAVEPKQVNLALETVLHFNKKDRSADLAVIDKVQNFLAQIKNTMKSNARRSGTHDMTFTDFILEAAKILRSFNDTELEDAYVVINEESRKYINMENDLRELFDNHDMRRYVSNQLDNVKEMEADDLRRHLDSAITVIEYNKKTGENNDILEVGNTLYDGASGKLRVALKNLVNLRRTNKFDLESVLRNTLRSLVFYHYLDLSDKVKGNLINMVKHYWRAFSDNIDDSDKQLKTVDVTPFKHEKVGKHGHKNRVYSHTKNDKTSESKSIERDAVRSSEKQEVFLTDNELHKLINNNKREEEKHKINKKKAHKNPENIKKPQPSHKQHHDNLHQSNNGKQKKNVRTSNRGHIEYTESDEPKVLMGGQIVRDVNFRGQRSSKESSTEEDKNEDETSTEEIIIQHNNVIDVGISQQGPARINITFVSSETHETNDKPRVMRKSNVNDKLEITSPEKSADVSKLIKNIEEQIQEVKDQVAYVKSLTQFKRTDNHKESMSSNKTDNVNGTEAVKPNSGFSFRATYDTDFSNSSETGINKHEVNKTMTEITSTNYTNSDSINANEIDESKIKNDVETATDNTKNKNEGELSHINDTHDLNEAIHDNDNIDMLKKEIHGNHENIITDVNVNSTPPYFDEAGTSGDGGIA